MTLRAVSSPEAGIPPEPAREGSLLAAAKATRPRLTGPERRATILLAAQAVFVAEGYAGARTRVIASQAGITEAILYQHFASKEELFEVAVLTPVQEKSIVLAEQLHAWVRTAQEAGAQNKEVVLREAHRIVLVGLAELVPLLGVAILADRRERTAGFRGDMYSEMARILERASTEIGAVRAVADDPLMLTLFAMSLGPVLDAHFREVTLDVDGVAAHTAAMLLHGLGRARPTPSAGAPPAAPGSRVKR